MVSRTVSRKFPKISSFGFSGAGFLASYHLGVVDCLQQQGLLSSLSSRTCGDTTSQQVPPRLLPLTGVSAGALVASTVAVGMEAADGVETVLDVARQTRQAGRLAALAPGFSLVDCMERAVRDCLQAAIADQDPTLVWQQCKHRLRIGLTDRREWPPVGPNPRAVVYVDEFRNLDDVVAACVLSSYVPGVTGPTWGSWDDRHSAILRSAQRLQEMVKAGCVKKGVTGEPLKFSEVSPDSRELHWDGGLVNAFPIFDRGTVIVTPIAADFCNASINPSIEYSDKGLNIRKWTANPTTKVHMTASNLHTFRSLLLNPDPENLQSFYIRGYDNCSTFLNKHSLLTEFTTRATTTTATTTTSTKNSTSQASVS